MSHISSLVRSLVITALLSFLAPILLIGGILLLLLMVEQLPLTEAIGHTALDQTVDFLRIFGSGSRLRGILVIGTVCSAVGVLFDTFSVYRQQNLRDMQNQSSTIRQSEN